MTQLLPMVGRGFPAPTATGQRSRLERKLSVSSSNLTNCALAAVFYTIALEFAWEDWYSKLCARIQQVVLQNANIAKCHFANSLADTFLRPKILLNINCIQESSGNVTPSCLLISSRINTPISDILCGIREDCLLPKMGNTWSLRRHKQTHDWKHVKNPYRLTFRCLTLPCNTKMNRERLPCTRQLSTSFIMYKKPILLASS